MHSLAQAACKVLETPEPDNKVKAAHTLSRLWREGEIDIAPAIENSPPPQQPGRPISPKLVDPRTLKRRRLGSVHGRVALLHAIAHIEFNAIDLAADMVARYAYDDRIADDKRMEFIEDWIGVCNDEARHFTLIQNRLKDMGSFYGDLQAHNGLWEAAVSTMDDLAARLVIAPMVLEARGLDVTPTMIEKLENVNDQKSADILKIIYAEEIGHVAAGVKWFTYICDQESREKEPYFKQLVHLHFKGNLKPPFNEKARAMAGLTSGFYYTE